MAVSISVIDLIQNAGATLYAVRTELLAAAAQQAEAVASSISADPFDARTDELFEQWKTLSRVQSELEGMDLRLRDIHASISALAYRNGNAAQVLQLASPPTPHKPRGRRPVTVTEAEDAKIVEPRSAPSALKGNNLKLFEYLRQHLLSTTESQHLHLSRAAEASGIPKGSINYSVSQLVARGLIIAGEKGTYRLA